MITIKANSKKLSSVRIRAGLSIHELAKKAKINYNTALHVENGQVSPNPATARKICAALNTDFGELFKLEEAAQQCQE